MSKAPDLLAVGMILLLASAATYATLRLTYGERPAYVHVRWAPSVDASTREQLERVHGLTRPELREGRTWGYYLTDLSGDNIERLVTNPAAEDTHNLHRTAFRVWRTAPRAPYLGSKPAWIAMLLEFLTRAFLGLGGLAVVVVGFRTWRARFAPAAGRP
jgi:hypothetical protein